MTPAQLTTLKSAILAETDATFVGFRNAGAVGQMANWLNTTATPAFTVWRSSLSLDEIYRALIWTEMAARTTQQLAVFEMLLLKREVDPRETVIRQAFADLFAGTTTLTNLTAAAKRTVTRAERVFATGTGSTGSPGSLSWEGTLSYIDIIDALRS